MHSDVKATAARFELNAPQVAQEMMGGEAMIIHFDTGAYYSAEGTGAEIWNMACYGASAGEIASALGASYGADPAEVAREVEDFLRRLSEEGLLRPAREHGIAPRPPFAAAPGAARRGASFPQPLLQKYTDLEDLLLLDPIHDVSEHGWPQKKSDDQHG